MHLLEVEVLAFGCAVVVSCLSITSLTSEYIFPQRHERCFLCSLVNLFEILHIHPDGKKPIMKWQYTVVCGKNTSVLFEQWCDVLQNQVYQRIRTMKKERVCVMLNYFLVIFFKSHCSHKVLKVKCLILNIKFTWNMLL